MNPMGLTEQLEQVRLGTRGRMGQSQKPNVKGTVKRMLKKVSVAQYLFFILSDDMETNMTAMYRM